MAPLLPTILIFDKISTNESPYSTLGKPTVVAAGGGQTFTVAGPPLLA